MAYVSNMDDDEKQANGTQGAISPMSGGAVHLAPSSGVGAGSGPATAGTGANPAGGSFATLDKYITANQGQAQPLANKITGSINNEYNQLDKGNQDTSAAVRNQVENAPGYTNGNMDLISQESASPVSFAGDANNVKAFQSQLTNKYTGPEKAAGTNEFQGQQAKINSAIAEGNAQTQTSAGRNQLIAKNSAAPTAGVTALNSAILSENPTYLGQVQDAYKPFGNLVSNLNSSASDIDKTIGTEKADASSSSAAANKAISDQITGLNSSVQGNLDTTIKNATSLNQQVRDQLASGNAENSTLSALGLSKDQWNALTAAEKAAATSDVQHSADNKFAVNSGTATLDPTQWLTQQDPNAVYNAANTANAGQYDQAKAFQTLLSGLNLNTPQAIINPADAAKAGTAPTNLNAFDYGTALNTNQSVDASTNAAAKAYADALQNGADEEHAQLAAANAQKNNMGALLGGAAVNTAGLGLPNLALGAGQNVASQVQNAVSSPQNAAKNVLANVATGGLYSTGQAVAGGVKNAVNTITQVFCFHPLTQVDMVSGGTKAICDIKVGEWTKGGIVLATTRGIGTQFYWYKNVLVTGKHAVKEDGQWIRVETSKLAKKFPGLTEVVCNLVTETHRIYINDIEFADEHETDLYESLDLDESLAEMNKNG